MIMVVITQLKFISICDIEESLKPKQISGLKGIQTHDLCDFGAVPNQLSYQAKWELVMLINSLTHVNK